jgi:ferric-dicitrate binding protein FerR (iron transport regulator)
MSDEKLREQREDALLRRLLRLAGNPAAVSDQVTLRVKENLHAHWKQELRENARKRRIWIFTATIAASLLFVTALWLSVASFKPQVEPVAIVENAVGRTLIQEPGSHTRNLIFRKSIVFTNTVVETDPEARVLLRIFGGVQLRMNPSSRIHFKSDSVLVLERGVVDLNTGKTHRHFIVSTSFGNVTDIGTRFQVRLNDNRIEIRVHEGAVSLDQNGKLTRAIPAGNRLIASANGEVLVSKFDPFESDEFDQMTADFNLEGRTLMEFLQWICKQNGWKLKFSDPRIEKNEGPVVLHGSITALTPQQMLAAVLPVCGLNYHLKDGILTITN